ncbi:MAG: nucleoside triphosphate pyrophosphohydrolase, partial [Pseudanabaena sp.]
MNFDSSAKLVALQHLIDVVAKLRSPDGGCPWD